MGINKYENERNLIVEEEVQRRVREKTMEIAKGMNKWVKRMKEYYTGQKVKFISYYSALLAFNKRNKTFEIFFRKIINSILGA